MVDAFAHFYNHFVPLLLHKIMGEQRMPRQKKPTLKTVGFFVCTLRRRLERHSECLSCWIDGLTGYGSVREHRDGLKLQRTLFGNNEIHYVSKLNDE
jgi:hypothetical protein